MKGNKWVGKVRRREVSFESWEKKNRVRLNEVVFCVNRCFVGCGVWCI